MYSTIASACSRTVAEVRQGARHGLVDDLHRAAADQLLELDQRQVGLHAGGVAVHHQADGAGRSQQAGLGIPVTVGLAEPQALVPGAVGGGQDLGIAPGRRDHLAAGGGMLGHHALVRGRVPRVPLIRPDYRGELGRAPVGGTGHQRGDRGRDRPAAVGVVGMTGRHQQRAEVGVADAKLPESPGGHRDLLGREVGEADRDVHRGNDQLGDPLEPLDIERVVITQELQQVNARQVARGIV